MQTGFVNFEILDVLLQFCLLCSDHLAGLSQILCNRWERLSWPSHHAMGICICRLHKIV